MSGSNHLSGLNPPQLEAVTHGNSPLLILAGAGSGKTRVITRRIVHLIQTNLAAPEAILAVTFTNKAAAEMKERAQLLDPRAQRSQIRTFHSFCSWFLRRNAQAAGLPESFTIYDDEDSQKIIKAAHPGLSLSEYKDLGRKISSCKDRALSPYDPQVDELYPGLAAVYQRYEKLLTQSGAVDFGGLILNTLNFLRSQQAAANRIRQRFTCLLVDEFQDTNLAQFLLLKALSPKGEWLTVVGDDDQSIYKFRGAEIQNILNFTAEYPGTSIVKLEENYRSTGNILASASAMIARNSGRLGKTLWTKSGPGEPVRVLFFQDQDEEAEFAAQYIQKTPGAETALLYRTNAQSRVLEMTLNRYHIPYRLVGGVGFFQREEVKDVLAYLAVMFNPRDRASLERIFNKPARGLGPEALKNALLLLEEGVLAGKFGNHPGWKGMAKKSILAFDILINTLAETGETLPLGDLIGLILESSGLGLFFQERDKKEGTDRLENIGELVSATAGFPPGREGVTAFLEQAALQGAVERDNGVTAKTLLITLHNAKGLEFDRVVITGLEEGLFPRAEHPEEVEEERRLFYVGMTRARQELLLTSARYRMLWGKTEYRQASSFLSDLPEENVLFIGAPEAPREGFGSGGWKSGQRVYHEDYGTGYVIRSWTAGADPVVQVRFDTGFIGKFLTAYTPLERIGSDE